MQNDLYTTAFLLMSVDSILSMVHVAMGGSGTFEVAMSSVAGRLGRAQGIREIIRPGLGHVRGNGGRDVGVVGRHGVGGVVVDRGVATEVRGRAGAHRVWVYNEGRIGKVK